jgi:ABC-type multidrug transport system permease subunit
MMILNLIKKDLKIFFSDRKGVLLTFLLPIVLISLFAFAFGGIGGSSSKSKPIELLLADNDISKTSQKIIARLDSLTTVKIIPIEETKGIEQVNKGKQVAILIFGKGFEAATLSNDELPLELKYDSSREIEMGMLQSVLMQELMSSIGESKIRNDIGVYIDKNFAGMNEQIKAKIFSDLDSKKNTSTSLTQSMQLKMTAVVKQSSKTGNVGLIQAVAGTAIMMLLFSISEIGGSLLQEKEEGTLKRLLYSPIKPMDILFGKMGIALVIAILQLVIMFVFAWLAFGLPIFTDLTSLIVLILVVAFAVSSFGIFLVSIVKTRKQLQGISTLVILMMSAIGGSMIPLFVMPAIMQKIAVISVNYWGIQGFYDIFFRHLPLIEIMPRILVLLGIGLVMTVISIQLFKRNVLKFN